MRLPNSRGDWLLGVDGGGTKTHFLLCRSDGSARHAYVGPGSYHPEIGIDGVAEVVGTGLNKLYRDAGICSHDLAFAFFGMPAFGEDAAGDAGLHQLFARLMGHDRFKCDNDMVCAWAGSLGGADGINIVAGTGSIAYGERNGLSARCGGWGELFGDEGSAYWTAIRGLSVFTHMSDGRLPRSLLYDRFRDHLEISDDFDVLERFVSQAGPRKDIASLAPIVSEAASAGDLVAQQILRDGAAALAAHAAVLARALKYDPDEIVPVSYSGGMFREGHGFLELVGDALRDLSPNLLLAPPVDPPHVGAVLVAARYANGSPMSGAELSTISRALSYKNEQRLPSSPGF